MVWRVATIFIADPDKSPSVDVSEEGLRRPTLNYISVRPRNVVPAHRRLVHIKINDRGSNCSTDDFFIKLYSRKV